MSVYQDRIQGTDRLLRIRRMKKVVYLVLVVLAVLLLYARMASEGAALKPLFLPLNGPLEVLLMMGLVGTLLEFYFRHLELQAAATDSQRFLMAKYSMSRAATTAGLCVALAILLLLPVTAPGTASLFTDPPRYVTVGALGTENITFTSPDPLGVSYVQSLHLTGLSGFAKVTLSRNGRELTGQWVNGSQVADIPVEPLGWAALANWTVSIHDVSNTQVAMVALVIVMGVMPTLFSTVPFLLILYAGANIVWWAHLRPVRERSRSAALYAGGAVTMDGGERAYIEYAANPVADVVPTTTRLVPPPPPSAPPPPPPPAPSAVLRPATSAPVPPSRAPARRAETPGSLTEKGDVLAIALQFEPALVAYDEALRLKADHAPALLGKARALDALRQPTGALDAYRKILSADPANEAALKAIPQVLVRQARWREGLEAVEAYLRRKPNDSWALEVKGDVLSNLGRRPEALAAYEAAHAIDPTNGNVKQKIEEVRVDVPGLLSRALIASASGNYAQALNLFDDILEVEPSNVNALIGKAVAYRRSGKPQEALNCLDLVLNIQPTNGAAFLNRGSVLVEQGDLDGALETFDKLVALVPEDWEAWVAQGDVLAKMGRDDDALRAYAEALKHNPGDEEIQRQIEELEASRHAPADVLHELYTIKGIGPARARALVDAGYKTAEDFRKATAEQLLGVKGITRKIAEDLLRHFKTTLVAAQ